MHTVEPHLIPRVPLRLDMSRRAALDSVRLEQVGPRGQSTLSDRCISPRLLSRAEAANYCGLSGTMMTLIAEFKASAEFRALAPSSLRAYLNYIKLIGDKFGDLPLAVLDDRRVRGEFKTWRDGFADTPRKADYAWTTLARSRAFRDDGGADVFHGGIVGWVMIGLSYGCCVCMGSEGEQYGKESSGPKARRNSG